MFTGFSLLMAQAGLQPIQSLDHFEDHHWVKLSPLDHTRRSSDCQAGENLGCAGTNLWESHDRTGRSPDGLRRPGKARVAVVASEKRAACRHTGRAPRPRSCLTLGHRFYPLTSFALDANSLGSKLRCESHQHLMWEYWSNCCQTYLTYFGRYVM